MATHHPLLVVTIAHSFTSASIHSAALQAMTELSSSLDRQALLVGLESDKVW